MNMENKASFKGQKYHFDLNYLWDLKDILNSRQNRPKNNAVTRVHARCSRTLSMGKTYQVRPLREL